MIHLIISASRRTDIPAFYTDWFINRINAGYCTVVNPFNRNQVSYVSLQPDDVDVIVFWTKNAIPLLPYLSMLERKGFKYYFQYTINGYPREFEKNVPGLEQSIKTFAQISEKLGPEKIIWRYDPICISNITDYGYHRDQFCHIAKELKNMTNRVVISVVDEYKKAIANFRRLKSQGIIVKTDAMGNNFGQLMRQFVDTVKENKMEIFSCAEVLDLTDYGVAAAKCIDSEYIKSAFNIEVSPQKDKSQRLECGCIQSKDIGAYDTCLHGCSYCYAGTINTALNNKSLHDVHSPSIIGRYDAPKPSGTKETKKNYPPIKQTQLF